MREAEVELFALLSMAKGGVGGFGPRPYKGYSIPDPQMTKAETIQYLKQLPEESRRRIADSPDGRIEGEAVGTFRLRMKLKKYVGATLDEK